MDDFHLLVIRSDGENSPTDELMSTDPITVTLTNKNVFNTTLKDFFTLLIFNELNNAFLNSPGICKSCCWEKICGDRGIVNRFSNKERFNNPSIYCDGLKLFYRELLHYLINSGIPIDKLKTELLCA